MPIDPYWRKALDSGYRAKHAAKDQRLKAKRGKQQKRPRAKAAPQDPTYFVRVTKGPFKEYISDDGSTPHLAKASKFTQEEAENLAADNRSAHPDYDFRVIRSAT